MASRNVNRAAAIAKDIREKTSNEKVSVMYVDIAVLSSVRELAQKFLAGEKIFFLFLC